MTLLNSNGGVEATFGESDLKCPSGLAVTREGCFVVTDFVADKVAVFSPAGTFLRYLRGRGVTFHQPRYVTVSCHGDVIVCDSGNHRLMVFDAAWNFVRSVGGYGRRDGCLKFPHAVCTDSCGNIIVADRYNDRVSVFTRRGQFARHLVTSAHKLRHPQGVALSPNHQLLVSHGGLKASRVMVLNLTSISDKTTAADLDNGRALQRGDREKSEEIYL